LIRYNRMQGKRALWVPGTDHAAIATQTKVEKIIKDSGETRHTLGRDKFLKRVRAFAQESHDTIVNQVKKMGSSCDWSREAYTLDETRHQAVNSVFKLMYDDGLIYRGKRIVNWCPRCHSTLADDEVEYREEDAKLYWIKYGPFVLATARPETKLGDTAVAVHPDDKRYKDMVGKEYDIPGVLGKFRVKVVEDRAVDMEFGSGAIKVTPAHSFVDNQIAEKNGVGMRQIIDEDGKMMENCGKYKGMTTTEARKEIVKDMKKMGLIDHVEDDYKHNIAVCYRCDTPIEPLPSLQWFIDVNKPLRDRPAPAKATAGKQQTINWEGKSIKDVCLEVIREGKIKIVPKRFEKSYFHWMENLRDWCISRQIWYGHQVPVWYKEKSKIKNQKSKIWSLKLYGKESYENIKNGAKVIETRAGKKEGAKKDWRDFQPGDIIDFSLVTEKNETMIESGLRKRIKSIHQYDSIDEILREIDINKITPGISTKDYKKKMDSYPGFKERLKKYGVWAFELEDVLADEIYVGVEPPAGDNWIQDEDTLDTWFSSGLWTFSTLASSPDQIKIEDGKLVIDSDDFRNFCKELLR